MTTDWRARHVEALSAPGDIESPYVDFIAAIEGWIEGNILPDPLISPELGTMLSAFRRLMLDNNTGWLNPGLLDEWVSAMSDDIGWDIDTERMTE